MLRDVSHQDISVTVLGHKLSMPICVSPSAYQAMAHPDGELATVRGNLIADISWHHRWFPREMTSEKWAQNSILMTRHYPDLGRPLIGRAAVGNLLQPIRRATQIWEGMRHQYGISALISHMSWFGGETSGGAANVGCFLRLLNSVLTLVIVDTTATPAPYVVGQF